MTDALDPDLLIAWDYEARGASDAEVLRMARDAVPRLVAEVERLRVELAVVDEHAAAFEQMDWVEVRRRALINELREFASTDLDQWVRWRLPMPYGDVFIAISKEQLPGTTADQYRELDGA